MMIWLFFSELLVSFCFSCDDWSPDNNANPSVFSVLVGNLKDWRYQYLDVNDQSSAVAVVPCLAWA